MAARRQGRYRVAGLDIDPRRRICALDGAEIPLTAQEFDLLEYLVRNPHRAIPASELKAGILPEDESGGIPLKQYLERLHKLLEVASGGENLLIEGEDGTHTLEAEVIFEPEIWADSAETTVEEVAPGYAPYLTGDEDADVVEGRRKWTPADRARLRRMVLVVVGVALAAVAAWGTWSWMHRPQPSGVKAVVSQMRDETEEIGAALDAAVRLELEQSPFMAVATPTQVSAALSSGQATAKASSVSGSEARRACRERGDDVYVSGDLRRVGNHLVVTLEAHDCATDQLRAHSAGIARDPAGVVSVLTPVSSDLRRQLGESRASVKRSSKALSHPGEAIVEALKDYAEAETQAGAGETDAAIVTMQKALDADQDFALAQMALSGFYEHARQPELASASLRHAYEERDHLLPDQVMQVKTEYAERVSEDLNAALEDAKVWGAAYRLNSAPQKAQARIEQQLGQPEASLNPAWKALELDDEDAGVYALLAEGQLEAGRLDEAQGTIRLATSHGLRNDRLHWIAFEIGVVREDQNAMQTVRAWAQNQPATMRIPEMRMPEMHMLDARREFAAGEVRDAEADATAAVAQWRDLGMVGEADRQLARTAWTETRLGLTATASTTMKDLPEMVDSAPMALVWAETGELEKATTEMQQGLAAHPAGTLWQQVWAPEIRAAIALAEDKPEAAVEALRIATGYEKRSPDIWLLRARAYLAEKQPELAEMEFRKLLSHPDADPLDVDYPLAQLGLARALAAEGREAEAATEFMMLQRSTWKTADKDLPPLRAAQEEQAKLSAVAQAAAQTATSASTVASPAEAPLRLPKPAPR